jgi:hypothetical protein
MNSRLAVPTIGVVAAAIVAATFVNDPHALAQSGARLPEPGEGVVCAWAIYTVASEVGKRCYPGEHAEVQAELHRAVSRIDAYVVANTKPPVTQQQLDKFKREQGHVGDLSLICTAGRASHSKVSG